jgi:antitoxin ParD1/3/4
VEQREASDAHKLAALRRAADQGWADIAAGRYADVAGGDLDDYIAGIGQRGTATAAED